MKWVALCLMGCASQAAGPAVSLPETLPRPISPVREDVRPAVKTSDDGDFTSNRGLVHLITEPGGFIGGSYPDGVLTCTHSGESLDCHWYESSSEGGARFTRKPNGDLAGSWGSGESTDDGGEWTLTPVGVGTGLNGAWDTNWGLVQVTDTGHGLHVEYRNGEGKMDCELKSGKNLICDWSESSLTGQAKLVIESPRIIRGTWGSGKSTTDGGPWVFIRR
jgi:hypothetical protein